MFCLFSPLTQYVGVIITVKIFETLDNITTVNYLTLVRSSEK